MRIHIRRTSNNKKISQRSSEGTGKSPTETLQIRIKSKCIAIIIRKNRNQVPRFMGK